MNEDVLVTRNENDPLEPRLVSVKGTLVVSLLRRDTAVVFGLAPKDTISGTRRTEQVPMFPTRSRPTKITLGWQQLDLNDAWTDVLTAPLLKALTERNTRTDRILTEASNREQFRSSLKGSLTIYLITDTIFKFYVREREITRIDTNAVKLVVRIAESEERREVCGRRSKSGPKAVPKMAGTVKKRERLTHCVIFWNRRSKNIHEGRGENQVQEAVTSDPLVFIPLAARKCFYIPMRVPLRFSREVIDKSPSPVSVNETCANHMLDTHSGLPYTPAHDPVWFVTIHNGGERSESC